MTNRFGRRLYGIFFKTYTEKVWGIPCTEIRAEWAAQRIQGLSLRRAHLSATVAQQALRPTIRTLIHEFQYPRLGPGQMWEMCRDRVVERGGTTCCCSTTCDRDSKSQRRPGHRRVAARHADGERRFEAEHVISTMPLRSLVRALAPVRRPRSATGAPRGSGIATSSSWR